MDHLRRLKQQPKVSKTNPGADLMSPVSSQRINVHKSVLKRFTFFEISFLYAFQNWTKSTTAPQPSNGTIS